MTPTLPPPLALRSVEDTDNPVLLAIYGSTRAEELALTDWTDEHKAEFVAMQFRAQTAHYRENYPGALYYLIRWGDAVAGRLYLHPRRDELRIMDLALLPDYRNRGIGGTVLRALQDDASRRGNRLSIHVEGFNPAQRLYRRLGFLPAGEAGVYLLMEWSATASRDNGPGERA